MQKWLNVCKSSLKWLKVKIKVDEEMKLDKQGQLLFSHDPMYIYNTTESSNKKGKNGKNVRINCSYMIHTWGLASGGKLS